MIRLLRASLVAMLSLAVTGCGNPEVEAIKDTVRSMMFDPDSAQFRNITAYKGAICGEVNAKNRLGGYGGFVPFVAMRGGVEIMEDSTLESLKRGPNCSNQYFDQLARMQEVYEACPAEAAERCEELAKQIDSIVAVCSEYYQVDCKPE